MDERSQTRFDTLLKKDPSELTKDDIAFLKARKSYLRPADKEYYKDILGETKQTKTKKS